MTGHGKKRVRLFFAVKNPVRNNAVPLFAAKAVEIFIHFVKNVQKRYPKCNRQKNLFILYLIGKARNDYFFLSSERQIAKR